MRTFLVWFIGGAAAYLLGSVPFGFILSKMAGVDIRKVGSGNIGATNVYRSVSKPLGLLTFALDFLKGVFGSTLLPHLCLTYIGVCGCLTSYFMLFCGIMTVFGHTWTCFLGGKGGKGVATSAGMLVGIAPLAVAVAFSVWLAVVLIVRYVSVASILAALTLGVIVWFRQFCPEDPNWIVPSVLTILALFVVWKHRSNLLRLMAGTEPHFTFRKGR